MSPGKPLPTQAAGLGIVSQGRRVQLPLSSHVSQHSGAGAGLARPSLLLLPGLGSPDPPSVCVAHGLPEVLGEQQTAGQPSHARCKRVSLQELTESRSLENLLYAACKRVDGTPNQLTSGPARLGLTLADQVKGAVHCQVQVSLKGEMSRVSKRHGAGGVCCPLEALRRGSRPDVLVNRRKMI